VAHGSRDTPSRSAAACQPSGPAGVLVAGGRAVARMKRSSAATIAAASPVVAASVLGLWEGTSRINRIIVPEVPMVRHPGPRDGVECGTWPSSFPYGSSPSRSPEHAVACSSPAPRKSSRQRSRSQSCCAASSPSASAQRVATRRALHVTPLNEPCPGRPRTIRDAQVEEVMGCSRIAARHRSPPRIRSSWPR
jgi:hypothetical protein